MRVEQLIYDAAVLIPGLTPTRAQVDAESALMQRDKEGHEVDQGIFVSKVLADVRSGTHLCHAMLMPRSEAVAQLADYEKTGHLDLGAAEIFRKGKASYVLQKNPRHLNAEDDTTIDAAEIAVDLAILDPQSQIGVLRGDYVQGGKYDGKRMLGSGINLTHLYYGKVPYIWYLQRDLGIVNKLFRGVAHEDMTPDDMNGQTIEKPWMAVVEQFAIGGHCQYLLTMDYVLAARGAFLTLPARKEGIIPGAANMRLPRFTGERIARQAIMYERRLDCDSPEGRLICDEVVEAGRHGRRNRTGRRQPHQFRRRQRCLESAGIPGNAGTAGPVSPLLRHLCAGAGLLPLQPRADLQPRAPLERQEAESSKASPPNAEAQRTQSTQRKNKGNENGELANFGGGVRHRRMRHYKITKRDCHIFSQFIHFSCSLFFLRVLRVLRASALGVDLDSVR